MLLVGVREKLAELREEKVRDRHRRREHRHPDPRVRVPGREWESGVRFSDGRVGDDAGEPRALGVRGGSGWGGQVVDGAPGVWKGKSPEGALGRDRDSAHGNRGAPVTRVGAPAANSGVVSAGAPVVGV